MEYSSEEEPQTQKMPTENGQCRMQTGLSSLVLTKWRSEVHRINIEDALCLGHSAMRKTKYDMARRIFSRLRRSRMNQAFKQWKLDTRDERENEERTHAIEAMSNWAARVSGGRVLKERFGLWFAFAKQKYIAKRPPMLITSE